MSDEKIDNTLFFSKLQAIEDDFEDVEVELLRQQAKLTGDLYVKRAQVIAGIPHFWPLVIEQSPADLDEYIQPSDSALLTTSLKDVSVERFELAAGGDPRSIAITFTFAPNKAFSDTTLEKKFWWRQGKDGWAGLVSEPVRIHWTSPDQDLTEGLLDLACQVHAAERQAGKRLADDAEPRKSLVAKVDASGGTGALSFFNWFGFCGPAISADESKAALQEEQAKRERRRAGEQVDDDDDDDDADVDDFDYSQFDSEIFPMAEDVAVCIAEDVFPNAIKYFIASMEEGDLSEADFEASDEEMEEAEDEEHTSKKRKA